MKETRVGIPGVLHKDDKEYFMKPYGMPDNILISFATDKDDEIGVIEDNMVEMKSHIKPIFIDSNKVATTRSKAGNVSDTLVATEWRKEDSLPIYNQKAFRNKFHKGETIKFQDGKIIIQSSKDLTDTSGSKYTDYIQTLISSHKNIEFLYPESLVKFNSSIDNILPIITLSSSNGTEEFLHEYSNLKIIPRFKLQDISLQLELEDIAVIYSSLDAITSSPKDRTMITDQSDLESFLQTKVQKTDYSIHLPPVTATGKKQPLVISLLVLPKTPIFKSSMIGKSLQIQPIYFSADQNPYYNGILFQVEGLFLNQNIPLMHVDDFLLGNLTVAYNGTLSFSVVNDIVIMTLIPHQFPEFESLGEYPVSSVYFAQGNPYSGSTLLYDSNELDKHSKDTIILSGFTIKPSEFPITVSSKNINRICKYRYIYRYRKV